MTTNKVGPIPCHVSMCSLTAIHHEDGRVYCHTHSNRKTPNLAYWIEYLGLKMGLEIIRHGYKSKYKDDYA